jgi:RES domain-containing protein
MLVEIGHGFAHRFDPLTICSYNVDVDDIVDLRTDSGRAAEAIELTSMSCPFATGARPDMANLVLWRWGPDLPHKVEVHDPGGRLPKDQFSWS